MSLSASSKKLETAQEKLDEAMLLCRSVGDKLEEVSNAIKDAGAIGEIDGINDLLIVCADLQSHFHTEIIGEMDGFRNSIDEMK